MKALYITLLLVAGIKITAQENRKTENSQTQEIASYKETKAFEAKMMIESKERATHKPVALKLASEEGLATKPQQTPKKGTVQNQGNLITDAKNIEQILASIPGRKNQSRTVSNNSQGSDK